MSKNFTLRQAQRGVCPLCGKNLPPASVLPGNIGNIRNLPTQDHVMPLSRGGYDGIGNLLVTHAGCNNRKADRLPYGCEIIWLTSVCEALDRPLRMKRNNLWRVTPTIADIVRRPA